MFLPFVMLSPIPSYVLIYQQQNLKMDFREICFISILSLIVMSAAFLIYLTFTTELAHVYKIRFFNFILQHFYSLFMLIKRKFFCDEEDTWGHLVWLIGFTSINFFTFLGVEIYCIVYEKSIKNEPTPQKLEFVSFSLLSYFHLYFQFNIYLGVFCLFSLAMVIVYYLNQRRHRHQMQQVLDQLQSNRYTTSWGEQNCSICLIQFNKSQKVYKLVCGHIFHQQCLQDWFKQKLTCPMCRDDVTRNINIHHYDEYSSLSSSRHI